MSVMSVQRFPSDA